jgi:hypothetical protein
VKRRRFGSSLCRTFKRPKLNQAEFLSSVCFLNPWAASSPGMRERNLKIISKACLVFVLFGEVPNRGEKGEGRLKNSLSKDSSRTTADPLLLPGVNDRGARLRVSGFRAI